jgi:hypothetical protein
MVAMWSFRLLGLPTNANAITVSTLGERNMRCRSPNVLMWKTCKVGVGLLSWVVFGWIGLCCVGLGFGLDGVVLGLIGLCWFGVVWFVFVFSLVRVVGGEAKGVCVCVGLASDL